MRNHILSFNKINWNLLFYIPYTKLPIIRTHIFQAHSGLKQINDISTLIMHVKSVMMCIRIMAGLADSIVKCAEVKSNVIEPVWRSTFERDRRYRNVVCTIVFQLSSHFRKCFFSLYVLCQIKTWLLTVLLVMAVLMHNMF